MIALNADYFDFDNLSLGGALNEVLEMSLVFYKKCQQRKALDRLTTPTIANYKCWDLDKDEDIFKGTIFSPFRTHHQNQEENLKPLVSVEGAIDDLRRVNGSLKVSRGFRKELKKLKKPSHHSGVMKANMTLRKNGYVVKQRFRLHQVLRKIAKKDPKTSYEIRKFLRRKQDVLSKKAIRTLTQHKFLSDELQLVSIKAAKMRNILVKIQSEKHTQRCLVPTDPAPAAMSIPDDIGHYAEDPKDIRTLTVREVARIQTFPDWFEFKSKETTGGEWRKHEVPQYTQVGNAVPPFLAMAIGEVVRSFLKKQSPGFAKN
jgi:DNA (cytosine-5)-methyltransferase 1